MSDLDGLERRDLENLFGMRDGYVLDFTDRTLRDFCLDYGVDIDADQYRQDGSSKAKRLRMFWKLGSNSDVGRLINALITYSSNQRFSDGQILSQSERTEIERCEAIAHRLRASTPDLTSLAAISCEKEFEVVVAEIRGAMTRGQPAAALDRLHTLAHKVLRVLCSDLHIETTKEKPLHSLCGEYVKALRRDSEFESEMTERILKSSISVFEAYNDVRNNKSLAHDNPILNNEEAHLIVNHVVATLRYLRSLRESKIAVSKQ